MRDEAPLLGPRGVAVEEEGGQAPSSAASAPRPGLLSSASGLPLLLLAGAGTALAVCRLSWRPGAPEHASPGGALFAETARELSLRSQAGVPSFGLTGATTAHRPAKACVKSGHACGWGDSCCGPVEHCFSKNEFYAVCKQHCEKVDQLEQGWSCMVLGSEEGHYLTPPANSVQQDLAPPPAAPSAIVEHSVVPPAPGPPPECSWEGEDCTASKCCRRVGFQCFERELGWASCSDDCANLRDTGGTWSCAVLGGDQGVEPVPQAASGHAKAGTSLFCFVVVTPMGVTAPGVEEGYEMKLWSLFKSKKVGVCACEAWSKFEGSRAGTGDWQSVVNTEIFAKVWRKVKAEGKYKQHDWTVKADADSVFFPDRLKAHLTGLQPPADLEVYLHNIDFKFKFQGALEVLSKKAVDTFLTGLQECSDHLGSDGGEDLFTMQCLDALKVGFMEDFKLLDDKYTHPKGWNLYDVDTCQDPAIVAFHPYKADYTWWGCFQVAMGMKPTRDFYSCDKRFEGDACSLTSKKAH